jgi:nicotinamide mononucleotide transporter
VIHELSVQLVGAWHEMSWIELVAAALAITYTALAIGQHMSCWFAAFVSSCLYVWICFRAYLYMESVLNVFYAVMAIYGFWKWRRAKQGTGAAPGIVRWPAAGHLAALAIVLLLSCITSWLLRRYTPAALPFWDSLEFWASIYATYLVARKVYENWHWFFAIDALGVCLYFNRRLFATMLLFGLYLVLIVIGMREWRRNLPAVHAPA